MDKILGLEEEEVMFVEAVPELQLKGVGIISQRDKWNVPVLSNQKSPHVSGL